MLKVTLFLQRSQFDEEDDMIRIYDDTDHRDMVRIVYSTPEVKKESTFYAPVSKAMSYVHDLLKSMQYDMQPFQYLQVTTALHPSILYATTELYSHDVRHSIEDMVEIALREDVFRSRRTSD